MIFNIGRLAAAGCNLTVAPRLSLSADVRDVRLNYIPQDGSFRFGLGSCFLERAAADDVPPRSDGVALTLIDAHPQSIFHSVCVHLPTHWVSTCHSCL